MRNEALTQSIAEGPHWRVTIRPETFETQRIKSVSESLALVTNAKVRLRGWDYPGMSGRDENLDIGENYAGFWSNFLGHREMWRMYTSGQFLHLFSVEEVTTPGWREKLASAWRFEVPNTPGEDVPGFLSIVNFLWTLTEIFEFAARLVQAGLHEEGVRISIGLHRIAGFRLSEEGRALYHDYATDEESLIKEWAIPAPDLLAASAEQSLMATLWYFERFRWLDPSLELLRAEQERLLNRAL